MAQYDVFANPSRSAADGILYVVVIQSDLLNSLATRMTMPLAVFDAATKVPTTLCPAITVKGKRLHVCAALPAKALRRPIDNVVAQASALASVMDTVLSGI